MTKFRQILAAAVLTAALASTAGAQFTRGYSPFPVVVDGDTLALPFWGGFNDPKPDLIDFDGDGLTDFFVGEIRGKLAYFRNTGTAAVPIWTPVQERFAGVDIGSWHTFCDIDADGDLDLFGDAHNAQTAFFRNETVGSTISFVHVSDTFGDFQTGQNNTCDFADIDDDGDFDFFFGNLAGGLTLYENVGDSANPSFVYVTDSYDSILAFPSGLLATQPQHGFSNIRFVDLDADQDLDLFYGDIFNLNMYYFVNNGVPDSSALAHVTDDYLPRPTKGFNHATLADLDGDLDLDLIVGAANGQTLNNLIYLRNDGNPTVPNFVELDSNLIKNIDVGAYGHPAVADMDADGDYDLLLGTGDGTIWYFQNKGDSRNASWELITRAYGAIDVGLAAAPEVVDWDADGDLDLLVGGENGKVAYYRNDGNRDSAAFVLADPQLAGILVDRVSTPRVADLNDDGLLDLVIGEWDFNGFANLRLYQNIGTADTPLLTLESTAILPRIFRDFTMPQIIDWDKDGRLDLIVGGRFFGLTLYRNTTASGTFPDSLTLIAQPDTLPGFDDGYRLVPIYADLDSDGDKDVLIGEEDGGIGFYWRDGGVYFLRGDCNASSEITSADIIYLVNYVFRGGPEPVPVVDAGDVNCTGTITSGDIIYLVSYVFRSGPPPCLM